MNRGTKDISQVYDRDNVCLFGVLRYIPNKTIGFIVASGHLLFNNNRGDVKLGQTIQIMNAVNQLKTFYGI